MSFEERLDTMLNLATQLRERWTEDIKPSNQSESTSLGPIQAPPELYELVSHFETTALQKEALQQRRNAEKKVLQAQVQAEMQFIEQKRRELTKRTEALKRQVKEHDRSELKKLSKRLKDTLQSELTRREEIEMKRAAATKERVTKDELESRLDLNLDNIEIWDSENDILYWIEDNLDGWVKEELQKEELDCVSEEEASEMIQSAVATYEEDYTGKFDFALASSGARIVYTNGMTSDTFTPSDSIVPSFVWHSIPRLPKFAMNYLNMQTPVLPPEEVLSPDTNLGSCWAMNGRSGQITIRLGQPVKVTSVTLDHVSPLLEPAGREKGLSAPRYVRVVGYPPCASGDNDCERLGFDARKPLELSEFQYLRASSDEDNGMAAVQSFKTIGSEEEEIKVTPKVEEDEVEDIAESVFEAPLEGGCSWTSCAPPQEGEEKKDDEAAEEERRANKLVKAVTLHVDENWGNEEFTCIYRFRVHGDSIHLL